ncbi:MAG: hypothetical protein MJ067_05385 [Oscillospiraceae bacterium]|nr:hypothetical protein [Oscillospiraceae bacterium]
MPNSVNLASKYKKQVDERFSRDSLAALAVSDDYSFSGVKTVNVYSIPTVPLGEYKGEKTADIENKENSAEKKTLSSACYALLEKGVMPSEEQLSAAGITKQQAESFIAALLSAGKIKSPAPAPSSPTGGETLILSSPGTGGKSLGAY